jgi:hypothetical protein
MTAAAPHQQRNPEEAAQVSAFSRSLHVESKRQRRCFIFAAAKVTMPSQTSGIVAVKSVGKIGDKQTSE